MSLEDAIKILDEATQPQMQGNITRQGYVRIEQALQVVKQALEAMKEGK